LIYLGSTVYVLSHIKCSLEPSIYVSITTILISQISNFIVYLTKVLIGDEVHYLAIYVAIIIAYYGLLSVLVYYTYQMKVVLMKLEETDPTNYYKGAQRANYACLAMYLAVFLSFTL
jgi:hypothetical protein